MGRKLVLIIGSIVLIFIGMMVIGEDGLIGVLAGVSNIGEPTFAEKYPIERPLSQLSSMDRMNCIHGDTNIGASFNCSTANYGTCVYTDVFAEPDPTVMNCQR